MTTILATTEGIFSDSNVDDDGVSFSSEKIFRIKKHLVGCSGDADLCAMFERLFKGGKVVPRATSKDDDGDFSALVVDPDGKIWHYDTTFTKNIVINNCMAIGSGGQAARAAYIAGATPEYAIKIACQIDTASQLPVQELYLDI